MALGPRGLSRLLDYQVIEAVKDGTFVILLEKFEPRPAAVHVLHLAHGQIPLIMCRFPDFATPRLQHTMSYGKTRDQSCISSAELTSASGGDAFGCG